MALKVHLVNWRFLQVSRSFVMRLRFRFEDDRRELERVLEHEHRVLLHQDQDELGRDSAVLGQSRLQGRLQHH